MKSKSTQIEHRDKQMTSNGLTQIVRLGLPGVHEPGLEEELSDEDLVLWGGHRTAVSLLCRIFFHSLWPSALPHLLPIFPCSGYTVQTLWGMLVKPLTAPCVLLYRKWKLLLTVALTSKAPVSPRRCRGANNWICALCLHVLVTFVYLLFDCFNCVFMNS